MTIEQSAWTGMVPVDDTALYLTDTGGPGPAVVYLNGAYADQSHWRRVIADLGSDYRHITYDERARGKSKRSADYSFEACIRDVDAVLEARSVDQPLLVGWSFGGVLAWHWADRNTDRVLGIVCVDAFPVGLTGEAGRERIRTMFRRWRLLFPIAARLGLAPGLAGAGQPPIWPDARPLAPPSPVAGSLGGLLPQVVGRNGNGTRRGDPSEAGREAAAPRRRTAAAGLFNSWARPAAMVPREMSLACCCSASPRLPNRSTTMATRLRRTEGQSESIRQKSSVSSA